MRLKASTTRTESSKGEESTCLGKAISEIIQRELNHDAASEKFYWEQTSQGQKCLTHSEDWRLLNFMPDLKRLHADIMNGDGVVVASTTLRLPKGCPAYRLTKLGRGVLGVCRTFAAHEGERRNWQERLKHHRFHPIVAAVLGAVMQWWKSICQWGEPSCPFLGTEKAGCIVSMEHFVELVRRICSSQAFRNILHDHERKEEDNFRSGCDYLTELFALRSRLLILRIDLYFRPEAKWWGYSEAADNAVDLYLRALRRGYIIKGVKVRYLVKRENGISRGMHYHVMAVLDGHCHRNAWILTQHMGEAWIKRVGRDKGSYFNCYARKDQYRYNGLGLVHVSDMNKLIGIRNALWYMSKQDCELQVSSAKVKHFWRGLPPGGPDGRGAPRKDQDSMVLVRRMLGGQRSKYPPGFEPSGLVGQAHGAQ